MHDCGVAGDAETGRAVVVLRNDSATALERNSMDIFRYRVTASTSQHQLHRKSAIVSVEVYCRSPYLKPISRRSGREEVDDVNRDPHGSTVLLSVTP